ncbi:MAG: DUF2807 domain-containing protein [Anaerolineae bacterium]|nr:DUF2807 domain-containing protein [Anaerolineae bacterium]
MGKQSILIIVLIGLLFAAACQTTVTTTETIKGSGTIITEERTVSGFSSVQVNLAADLTLIQGDQEGLTIAADDNLMPSIQSTVQNGKLVIGFPNNTSMSPSRTIQLTLTFKALTAVDVYGMSTVTADDLDLNALAIDFKGSGSTRMTGRVVTQTITIEGMAFVNNFDLDSTTVSVNIAGTGTVDVKASSSLDVRVAGQGTIRYLGSPSITQDISGSATITQQK